MFKSFNTASFTAVIATFLAAPALANSTLGSFGARTVSGEFNVATIDNPEQDTNYFAEVSKWYAEGKEITFDDARGAWSGRCFEKVKPKAAINALLLSHEKDELGPGFDTQRYLGMLVHTAKGPAYFDDYDINVDAENAKQVMRDIVASKKFSFVKDTDGTLGWTLDFEPNGRLDIQYSIRKYDKFLIVRGANLIRNNIIVSNALGKQVSGVEIGDWSYCYYFKDLTE